MDAGVPIKAAVAGIAMGLVKKATTTLYCLTFWATKITWAYGLQSCGFPRRYLCIADGYQIEGITKEIMQVALNQAKGAVCISWA